MRRRPGYYPSIRDDGGTYRFNMGLGLAAAATPCLASASLFVIVGPNAGNRESTLRAGAILDAILQPRPCHERRTSSFLALRAIVFAPSL